MIENNDDECNNNYGWFYLKQIDGQSFADITTDITTCLAGKRIGYHAPMVLVHAEYFKDKYFKDKHFRDKYFRDSMIKVSSNQMKELIATEEETEKWFQNYRK